MMIPTNSVLHGDAIQMLRKLPAGLAQAVVADPPYYGVLKNKWDNQWRNYDEYLDWCREWLSESMRVLREDGLCFVCGQVGQREWGFFQFITSALGQFQFHDLIIWDRAVGYQRGNSFDPAYEMVLVLRKSDHVKFHKGAVRTPYTEEQIKRYSRDKRYANKQARLNHLRKGKFLTNIIRIPSLRGSLGEKCGHPSQKPLELIKKLILVSTDEGDIGIDPFLGFGTTALASAWLGRRFIGIEREDKYCRMARKRLRVFGEKLVILDRTVVSPIQETGDGHFRENSNDLSFNRTRDAIGATQFSNASYKST